MPLNSTLSVQRPITQAEKRDLIPLSFINEDSSRQARVSESWYWPNLSLSRHAPLIACEVWLEVFPLSMSELIQRQTPQINLPPALPRHRLGTSHVITIRGAIHQVGMRDTASHVMEECLCTRTSSGPTNIRFSYTTYATLRRDIGPHTINQDIDVHTTVYITEMALE